MKLKALFGLATVVLCAMTGSAAAGNAHAYNGSYCKALYSSQATDFLYDSSGIYNFGGNRWIICPIIVDEIGNTSGTSRIWIHWGGLRIASDPITCTLYSRTGTGSLVQSQTASDTDGGWFSMPNLTMDDYWGSYSLICKLPAAGYVWVNTIWISERS